MSGALRVASWNINSVRLRIGLVEHVTRVLAPDVLCLQETKVSDDKFPHAAIEEMGYAHRAITGTRSHHGVAILSKRPIETVVRRDWCGLSDGRYVMARVEGIDFHDFYVPSGGDEPDPEVNPKFRHKLDFLDEMAVWCREKIDQGRAAVLVGDLNVAPLETDVWSHKQLLRVVSHTPAETGKLEAARAAGGWIDSVRQIIPPEEKLYSWWSYRARDWAASNRGRRLDHVWVTPAMQGRIEAAGVLAEARGWERPSDHVPVWADISVPD